MQWVTTILAQSLNPHNTSDPREIWKDGYWIEDYRRITVAYRARRKAYYPDRRYAPRRSPVLAGVTPYRYTCVYHGIYPRHLGVDRYRGFE